MKTVGVIGGMGPLATVDFFARLTAATPAKRDQDHLHVIVNSDPRAPDRNEAIAGKGPSPGPVMAAMARALENAGADFLVIACNTAHAYLADVRTATSLPVLDMVTATVAAVKARHPACEAVGLLAVDGCLGANLYQQALIDAGLRHIVLDADRQAAFMSLIYDVKSGADLSEAGGALLELIDHLGKSGADVIVAACTEIPIILGEVNRPNIPIIISTDEIVSHIIEYSKN